MTNNEGYRPGYYSALLVIMISSTKSVQMTLYQPSDINCAPTESAPYLHDSIPVIVGGIAGN
jgi:hypothetical protein